MLKDCNSINSLIVKFHVNRKDFEEIVILPILQSSNEGDVVLDPFMGSGTTGIVCD
jgi:DNA modification methylase